MRAVLRDRDVRLLMTGQALSLFGDRAMFLVLGIWVLQLMISPLWLRFFLYGPLEWLWRSLTYWRWQPFRRRVEVGEPTTLPGYPP